MTPVSVHWNLNAPAMLHSYMKGLQGLFDGLHAAPRKLVLVEPHDRVCQPCQGRRRP